MRRCRIDSYYPRYRPTRASSRIPELVGRQENLIGRSLFGQWMQETLLRNFSRS